VGQDVDAGWCLGEGFLHHRLSLDQTLQRLQAQGEFDLEIDVLRKASRCLCTHLDGLRIVALAMEMGTKNIPAQGPVWVLGDEHAGGEFDGAVLLEDVDQ